MKHFDVIIVGAGISGIGTACYLKEKCPEKSFAILESRENIGGTWDLFKYPGIRSDSDMMTLSYQFKRWNTSDVVVDGPTIKKYLVDTAKEYEIDKNIFFSSKMLRADWSSEKSQWAITLEREGQKEVFTCNFISMCTGYYKYDKGYTPEFAGLKDFSGKVIHPQHWPEDLDYSDKKVTVIGSGATAITLVPAMTDKAKHVTMLQRSPSYVFSMPNKDKIAWILQLLLPEKLSGKLIWKKNVWFQRYLYDLAQSKPEKMKNFFIGRVRKALGKVLNVEKHFTPRYNPWDQRLCLIPNADFYKALKKRKASVVTDEIDKFVEGGIQLKSGDTLDADIVVTATGLNVQFLGGVPFYLDGQPVNFSEKFMYKGMMFSDVPNMMNTFGYVNASWTLRVDLNAQWLCNLLNLMDEKKTAKVVPKLRAYEKDMKPKDLITEFTPGYLQRARQEMPQQGNEWPWINTQNFPLDKKLIIEDPIEDDVLRFSGRAKNTIPIEKIDGVNLSAKQPT